MIFDLLIKALTTNKMANRASEEYSSTERYEKPRWSVFQKNLTSNDDHT
jgi:hypothetical protein